MSICLFCLGPFVGYLISTAYWQFLVLNVLASQRCEVLSPLELRIEELRHHIKIETALIDGAKNAVKLLQMQKAPDKKALQEVCVILAAPWEKSYNCICKQQRFRRACALAQTRQNLFCLVT